MSREVLLDLTFLTEEERDLISNVLSKDAEIRKQEQNRINTLRKELDRLKEDGLPEDELESKNDNYCARCQTYFGIVFNRGAFCPRCELKVCKVCRVSDVDEGWICTLCHKVREVKAQSGAWFFQGHKEKNGKLFGSMLVRQSLRRLPGSWSPPQKDEETPTRYASPKKDYGELDPFAAVNHARSPGKYPKQPDVNSNKARRNGGHQIGYQYSDESDVQSEQGSHDASVEDNHDLDTASERTPSKGESDGSESLDSDLEETIANDVHKFSPVASHVKEESSREDPAVPSKEKLQGGLVQQGALEDIMDDNAVPGDVRRGTQSSVEVAYMTQQSGDNRGQTGSVEEIKNDEEILEYTRKIDSRPSSLSLDEDISYVSAPRFDIPMKRRKYSDGEDPALKLERQKSLSKSEEHLQEIRKKFEQEPSRELVEFTGTRSETKEQKSGDVHEDKFDKRKEDSASYVVEGNKSVGESFIEQSAGDTTPKIDSGTLDDLGFGYNVHKESELSVESSFEIPCENSSAAQYSRQLGNNESEAYKESEVVVEISPDIEKPNNEQLNIRNDSFSEKEVELSVTDDFGEKTYAISSENGDSQKGSATDLPKDVTEEGRDSENIQVLSVLSRVKNWERKSTGDNVGVGLKQMRSTSDIKRQEIPKSRDEFEGKMISYKSVVEELKMNNDKGTAVTNNEGTVTEGEKKAFDLEDEKMTDLHSISPEASVGSNEEIAASELNKDIEEDKIEDISLMASTSVADQEFVLYDQPDSVNELTRDDGSIHENQVYKESATTIESLPENDDRRPINEDLSLNEVESEVDPVTAPNVMQTSYRESYDKEDVSPDIISSGDAMQIDIPVEDITTPKYDIKAENLEIDTEAPEDDLSAYKRVDSGVNHELSSGINNLALSSANTDSSFKNGGNLTSSPLKSNTFVDTDAASMPAQYQQEETGGDYFGLEEDTQKAGDETETPREAEASPIEDILEPKPDTSPKFDELEPYSSEANIDQPAHEEGPHSFDSRESALRAFSETFVSANLGLKRGESHAGPDARDDPDSDVKLDGDVGLDTEQNREDQENLEERGYLEDRGNEAAREDHEYLEDHENREDRGTRVGLENRRTSDGFDSRRSSDLHYEGFHADNESMISETSGYGTPTVIEETSSKQTPSISGDKGMNSPAGNASLGRQTSETTPVIVTTDVGDDNVRRRQRQEHDRNSSITDFDEDLDVSFSKYGGGLGNRLLKDQLSMGSRESIVSYYSNAGGEVYGKYPVSGEVLFGIKYDPKIQEFQIQVHQAKDITAVDKKSNTSDPYVKTYLLPDRSRTGKRKSKVKKHTLNPVFDEILTYKISYDEILQRTLWLAIWNHDTFGHNDFLGEVLVAIDQYQQSGFSLEDPEPQWYELCERQAEDPQFSYNGEIVFSLKYVPPSALVSSKKKKKKKKAEEEKGELHVNIIEASNLQAKDANGFSDPFCKSYLLPDKSKKSKQKTPVIKKSLNPKWNYHIVYDNVTHEELMDRVLELTIWDFDRGSSNEFLGGVRLGLGAGLQEWDDANSEEQAAWNKMLNNQNDWNQVNLTLRDHMGSHKSSDFFSSSGLDPTLMDIKPVRPRSDPWLMEKVSKSPDDELIRHHEYHSPRESKIAAAMRLSQDRLDETRKTTDDRPDTAKKITLAELARSSPKHKTSTSSENKQFGNPPSANTSFSSPSSVAPNPARTPHPDIIPEEASHPTSLTVDPLVRHSEFYKGSTNVMRRPSAENQQSFQGPRERGGSTLADLIKQENVDNDRLLGSNSEINEELAGSRDSIYSNDGVYGIHDVKGEILLGYQYIKGSFKVKVFEARGLTAVDKTQNTSNPYVKVYLLPDQSRTGKRKTKTKYATLEPEFNEEMLYKISTAELVRRTVWISLWHYDRFGRNEFLGEVRIPLGDYQGSEVAADWYPLLPLQSKSSDNDQGQLVVGLMYSPADKKRKSGQGEGKLYVKIIEARNLAGKDADNLSDPFCKSYLLPDSQKKSKRKTPVKKRNLNPRWDYKFSYDNISIDDLQHRVLELTVWDHDLGTSNDFLGGVRIGLGTSDESWDDCTGEEVTLWQFLLSKPNTWAESTLPLRNEMGSRKGLQI